MKISEDPVMRNLCLGLTFFFCFSVAAQDQPKVLSTAGQRLVENIDRAISVEQRLGSDSREPVLVQDPCRIIFFVREAFAKCSVKGLKSFTDDAAILLSRYSCEGFSKLDSGATRAGTIGGTFSGIALRYLPDGRLETLGGEPFEQAVGSGGAKLISSPRTAELYNEDLRVAETFVQQTNCKMAHKPIDLSKLKDQTSPAPVVTPTPAFGSGVN